MENKLAFANERFGNDVFATQTTGIEIVAADIHYAKCRLQVDGRHRNAMGAVMGGVIYTLADFAFAIAANMDELDTVSLTSNVAFLGQPKGDTLFAEYEDAPGVLGRIAGILGAENINITDIRAPQDRESGRALAVIKTNMAVPANVSAKIAEAVKAINVFTFDA